MDTKLHGHKVAWTHSCMDTKLHVHKDATFPYHSPFHNNFLHHSPDHSGSFLAFSLTSWIAQAGLAQAGLAQVVLAQVGLAQVACIYTLGAEILNFFLEMLP